MPVTVGSMAPDFEAEGTGLEASGGRFRLSENRGRRIVLAFYPGDKTPVCTKQLSSYNRDLAGFEELDASIVGISPQGLESHREFAAEQNLEFPLLVDTDKKLGDMYGVVGPLGFYRRSLFVVDAEGVIRFVRRGLAGLTFVSAEQIREALSSIST